MLLEDEFNITFQNTDEITEDLSLFKLINLITEELPCGTAHKVV